MDPHQKRAFRLADYTLVALAILFFVCCGIPLLFFGFSAIAGDPDPSLTAPSKSRP